MRAGKKWGREGTGAALSVYHKIVIIRTGTETGDQEVRTV